MHAYKKKVDFSICIPEIIQTGEEIGETGIVIENSGNMSLVIKCELLFQNLQTGKQWKKKIRGSAPAGKQTLLPVEWKKIDVGMWNVSCKRIWIYEWSGWFCVRKKGEKTGQVIVLPERFEIAVTVGIRTRLFLSDGELFHPQWKGNDQTEILNLREYQKGDRLKQVHWKLSARNNMMIVKEMSMPVGCAVVFFLNMDNSRMKQMEQKNYWEIVYSISAGMLEEDCFHYLVWYERNEKKVFRKAIQSQEELYEFWVELSQCQMGVTDLKSQYSDEFSGDTYASFLELNEKLELFCNERMEAKFKEKSVKKKLQEMELKL